MACPVNAVEITASAMIAGTNVAARFGPNEPSGSSVQPDQQRDRDEHGQQQLLAVAQQQLQLQPELRGQHLAPVGRSRVAA